MKKTRKNWMLIQSKIEQNLELGCAIIFLILHTFFIVLFSLKHIYIMAGVNVGSVICYCLEIYLACHKKKFLFYNLLSLEILIHMALCQICIGGTGCFYIYSYCVINYLYFQSFISKKSMLHKWNSILWLIIFTIFPIIAMIWDQYYGPIYEMPGQSFLFSIVNTVVVAFFMNYFLIISGRAINKYETVLIEKNQQLEEISFVDPLTGLWNRRRLYQDFDEEVNETEAYSIILGDIDDFKKVNDTYGHECGDLVLIRIAQLIQNEIKNSGYVYRWGGEEILILLPTCSKKEAALCAEYILSKIKNTVIAYNGTHLNVTMTMGVAEGYGKSNLDVITRKADDCLYIGKAKGKAQVKY